MTRLKDTSENPFGAWLQLKRTQQGWSVRKLAEEAGVCSPSFISQLENNTYVGKKGKPMQPDEEIVKGLAKALGASVSEALRIAGYAEDAENRAGEETSAVRKPANFAEFAEALESMGIFDLQMFGGEEVFDNFTDFDYELFLEKMRNDVLIEVKRKGAGK